MKRPVLILAAIVLALVSLIAWGGRLGNLSSDSTVFTPADDVDAPSVTTKDGFPVFEIRVPDGYVEVQVRASLSNFEPGFLLKDGTEYVLNYIPTGEEVAGRKVYRALGTQHEARWDTDAQLWSFGYKGIVAVDGAIEPWSIPAYKLEGQPTAGNFSLKKEYFVYRFCTTGIPSDAEWGKGSGDPDAWVYIANQSASPGDNTEFKRVKWDQNSSLESQLQPAGTPGYTVLFQPSRGNLGAVEWMQQNQDKLVWIYQVDSPAGKPKHPNGSDVWNALHPAEWRKNRITLTN
jgi:hypothetical protein